MGAQISSFVFMPPNRNTYTWWEPAKCTRLETKSGKSIPAYWLPSPDPKETRTIIYSHGNATDIGEMYLFVETMRNKTGYNVLHYEYLGYGLARGENSNEKPSEEGVYESMEAALYFLKKKHNIYPKDIVIMGTSIGSGPSVYAAARDKFKGLILESPFTSIARILPSVGGRIAKMAWDMFPSIDRIQNVSCPVFIIHGEKDALVPCDHGKQLYKHVRNKYPPIWIPNAGHNNIRSTLGKQYWPAICDFLQSLEPAPAAAPSSSSSSTLTEAGTSAMVADIVATANFFNSSSNSNNSNNSNRNGVSKNNSINDNNNGEGAEVEVWDDFSTTPTPTLTSSILSNLADLEEEQEEGEGEGELDNNNNSSSS